MKMELWELTDHCCRHCMGRVLKRTSPDVVVRCAECGHSLVGEPKDICWCGEEVRGHGAMFECIKNPNKSDSTPHDILVQERPVENSTVRELKIPMRVNCGE